MIYQKTYTSPKQDQLPGQRTKTKKWTCSVFDPNHSLTKFFKIRSLQDFSERYYGQAVSDETAHFDMRYRHCSGKQVQNFLKKIKKVLDKQERTWYDVKVAAVLMKNGSTK